MKIKSNHICIMKFLFFSYEKLHSNLLLGFGYINGLRNE